MTQNKNSSTDATRFLDQPPEGAGSAGLAPGTQVDDYVIRKLLGEGGMGRVYRATQLRPIQREVALKLLRAEMTEPAARASFELERQALALMQHPGIAQVFDAGTSEDGQGFIAMEMVEGRSISEYCAAHELPRRQRLALFQRLCRAVQHAHQKGVIHRDIKPSNVLVREVDGVAWPTLIDFGIATAGDQRAGNAEYAGTVTWMSPEQADDAGRGIDTRSDVYSLGVLLFDLLVEDDPVELTTPLFHSGADVRSSLLELDANTPGEDGVRGVLLQAARHLPAELRAVLSKALASEREDRYESAAALAEDLQRWLQRRPVLARRQTPVYQARKFIARHRLGLALMALMVLALAGSLVVALQGRHQAQVAAERAQRTADFLSDILRGTDPVVAKGLDDTLMRKVLDNAADRAGSELAGHPHVRASIEETIAKTYDALGLYAEGAKHQAVAVEAARQAGLPNAFQAKLQIDLLLRQSSSGESVDELLTASGEIDALLADVPDDNKTKLIVQSKLAKLLGQAGQLEDAVASLRQVLATYREMDSPPMHNIIANQALLASFYSLMGRYSDAESLLRKIVRYDKKTHGEKHPYTVQDASELAVTLMQQHRYAEAEKLLRHYVPVAQELFDADSPRLMTLYSNLGAAIRQQGRNAEAKPYYERVLAWSMDRYGAASVRAVTAQINMALLLRDTGELDRAEQHAQQAVEHMDAAFGSRSGRRGNTLKVLGSIQIRQGEYAEAKASLDRGWKIFTTASGYGADHPRAQQLVATQVALYKAWGKPDKVALWQAKRTQEHDHDD